jgi:hypothetical protein
MYQLLDRVLDLPLTDEDIVAVQKGMNKVMISVGEHISEPSQVFLVTGTAGAGLSTYAVFYLIDPRIHVIYGYDANPYDAARQEEIEQEGAEFLEEMGAILEVVAWDEMTMESKDEWLAKQHLLSPEEDAIELDAAEIIEDVEVIEEVEIIEEDDEDPEDDPPDGDEIEELAVEAEEVADEEDEPPEEPAGEAEEAGKIEEEEKEDDVDDDDETDPLKAAFLKPEVKKAVSRSRKVKRVKVSEVEAELEKEAPPAAEAVPDEEKEAARDADESEGGEEMLPADDGSEDSLEIDIEEPETEEEDIDEDLFTDEELDRAEEAILSGSEDDKETDEQAAKNHVPAPDDDTVKMILRFFSRI